MTREVIDAWNQTDPATRRAAVGTPYGADARYVDPMVGGALMSLPDGLATACRGVPGGGM